MIRFARNLNNERVFIEEAIFGGTYYCEECRTEMIAKNKGILMAHHFAHKPDNSLVQRECIARNNSYQENQMSEWHLFWQEQYPKQNREVVFRIGNRFRRADIAFPDKKEILEFQHSPIKHDVWYKRTAFYEELGFHTIWVFDFDTYYEKFDYTDSLFARRYKKKYQETFSMDKRTYVKIFGDFRPQLGSFHTDIYFTFDEDNYFQKLDYVAGSFENKYPLTLFTTPLTKIEFRRKIFLEQNPNIMYGIDWEKFRNSGRK